MPKKPEETTVKDVQYPDDLPGEKWTISEYLYWDASDEEDREDLPEAAQYGLWLPVHEAGNGEATTWLSCPRALRVALEEAEVAEGTTFEVLDIQKGPNDHDPYTVDIRTVEKGDPA